MRIRSPGALVFLMAATSALAADFATEKANVRVMPVVQGLEHPWSIAFLPDRSMLVTERPGRMRIVGLDGTLSAPIAGVPEVVAQGQGGLLDVALDPNYHMNGWIYFSYAEPRGGGTNATAVARAKLSGATLKDLEVIFRQQPAVESAAHFGGRLAFDRGGRLFITLGERSAKHFIDRAQQLENHFGKIVRIERDGRIPTDNPFVGQGAAPEIWSYGHRNPQGAAIHPETGDLWSSEHGPKGGDELNVVRPGRNYGWPVITYGVTYSGELIGEGTHKRGMEQPIHYWVPSIGTCGLSFYSSDRIPGWKGSVFVGGLVQKALTRLEFDGERVRHEERLFGELSQRIRDVRQGPDGYLYLLTDSPHGQLLRVEPLPDAN